VKQQGPKSNMRLQDKVAVVTGSSRNIGLGIALRLANEGARVVVHGLHAERVDAATRAVAETGAQVIGVTADVSRAEGAALLIERTMAAYGRIDILVNNAAVTATIKPFLELTPEIWDHILGVNLGGLFQCSVPVARIMARQGSGCIVNISSVGGFRAHRQQAAYDASKGGIDAATRAMALELAPLGIRVNVVSPGLVCTDRWDGVDEAELQKRRSAIPLGREGVAADTAAAVAFLCSEDAAYITGQTIFVDGGLTAQLRPPDAEQSATPRK
jgi:NAD(P)-dependent dehydrogenase (short-subunit alcohol dehydrogenase family)